MTITNQNTMSHELQTTHITEEQVIIAFHSFLQAALAQAHAEQLLEPSILNKAEADIQIIGPSICLYLAALHSQDQPPSISTTKLKLDQNNCPDSFKNWFQLWSNSIPIIKSLDEDHRHDLVRILCDLEPISQPIHLELPIIAHNLRAIAIQISQRRTFQERFNEDLNFALQHGPQLSNPPRQSTAHFIPPPSYEEVHQNHRPASTHSKSSKFAVDPSSHPPNLPPSDPTRSPLADLSPQQLITLTIIRETIYASLTDVLYSTPSLHQTLQSPSSTDPQLARAYFAALCLAILEVSLMRVNVQSGQVNVVQLSPSQPKTLTLESCPIPYQPLMERLIQIANLTQAIAHEDDQLAMQAALSDDHPQIFPPKIDRLRLELEQGTHEDETDLVIRRAANAINAVGLKISQIESFRVKEEELFEILIPNLSQRQRSKR